MIASPTANKITKTDTTFIFVCFFVYVKFRIILFTFFRG